MRVQIAHRQSCTCEDRHFWLKFSDPDHAGIYSIGVTVFRSRCIPGGMEEAPIEPTIERPERPPRNDAVRLQTDAVPSFFYSSDIYSCTLPPEWTLPP